MGNVVAFNDSLRSLVGSLGDPSRDKRAGVYYSPAILTDQQLLDAYRDSWLARKIVNIPAQDSVRKGRDWQAENDQIELIEAEEKRLGFWQKLLDAKIKARLWGGAAIYIGTDQSPETPFEIERIGKGGIRYLTVLSRREVISGELDQDTLSETYGRPSIYEVMGHGNMPKVHPSRLAIFVGAPHPDPWTAAGPTRGWGDSALQSVMDAMQNADSAAANVASLIFEANVDVFRIPDFMANLADPRYETTIQQRFTLAATAKSINKALLLDKDEEYERKTISFATLPDVMQQFMLLVSGAADIPVTRLLGQSPAGLSATGESDIRNYYDHVQFVQEIETTPALARLDEALIRSALGSRPAEIYYRWAPLWQLSEKEEAEVNKLNAEADKIYADTGIINPPVLSRIVLNRLTENGTYPGIEAAIDEFGEEPDLMEPGEGEEGDPAPTDRRRAEDAKPRTLYVRRDVVNKAEIIRWAKGQGFTDIVPDLHVTIAYSRTPVDWFKVGTSWSDKIEIAAGGPRQMERLGANDEYVALLITANELVWRNQEIRDKGASWDWPDYQPHITIQVGGTIDLDQVEPYQGRIILGPEIFEEVEE